MNDHRHPPTAPELIATLRDARAKRDRRALIAAADALKVLIPFGGYRTALSQAWPDLTRPERFLSKQRAHEERRRRKIEKEPLPSLDDAAADLYRRLRPIVALSPAGQRQRIIALSRDTGLSERTLELRLRAVRRDGFKALEKKARSDAGRVRVPEDVREAFTARRLQMPHERISWAIRAIQSDFPDREISEHSLRRLARSIPKALTMKKQDWRATFQPGRNWEVPYPNHTHTFDMTVADLFVWDGDPQEKPYRPHLTAIVDEHTHCCLFGLYSKETPSRAILQSVLLHAWLPKPDPKWPMYGAPEHLHADNGKVQDSHWIEAVCQTLGADLDLCGDLRHAAVRSPWQQGHIERFFGIVHEGFEAQLGAAYCGNSPDNQPKSFEDPGRGIRTWQKYPTLEVLNHAFWIWVPAQYHQLHHRRLGMTRLHAWRLESQGHIRQPDKDYLYQTLLQRAGKRRVARGRVRVNTYTYWHRLLQGYEGTSLEVRWDPADLGRVLIFGLDGQQLCEAERDERKFVDDPASLAEHRERQREIKAQKKLLTEAVSTMAPTDERTFREQMERLEEEHRKQVIPFPGGVRPEKPEPDEELTAEELLELHPERPADSDDDDGFTIHGLKV